MGDQFQTFTIKSNFRGLLFILVQLGVSSRGGMNLKCRKYKRRLALPLLPSSRRPIPLARSARERDLTLVSHISNVGEVAEELEVVDERCASACVSFTPNAKTPPNPVLGGSADWQSRSKSGRRGLGKSTKPREGAFRARARERACFRRVVGRGGRGFGLRRRKMAGKSASGSGVRR